MVSAFKSVDGVDGSSSHQKHRHGVKKTGAKNVQPIHEETVVVSVTWYKVVTFRDTRSMRHMTARVFW